MSVNVTINQEVYKYPTQGESSGSGYGEEASAAFVALVEKVNSITGDNDILLSSTGLADNTTSDTAVTGLLFSSSLSRAAEITYYITRTGREYGKMLVSYNGSSWDIEQGVVIGDEGILFTISSAGQVQYQSSSTGTAGTIYFYTKSLDV